MSIKYAIATLAVVLATSVVADPADAHEPIRWWPYRLSQSHTWHGGYFHSEYGTPVALVVPPTAQLRTDYGWGVGNTRIRRIDHQFKYGFPGTAGSVAGGGGFRATPPWPSDTTQFGVYYVRGPW